MVLDPAVFFLGLSFVLFLQLLLIIGLAWALIELRAMQKATHSVQLVPVDQEFQKITKEVKESLGKELFDNVE